MEDRKKGQLLMIICAVLWSSSGIIFKYIPWSPFLIAGGRAVLSSGVLYGCMRLTGKNFKLSKTAVISAIMTFGNLVGFVAANKLTTAANAIVLQYWAPIFVILVLWLVYKEKPKRYELIFAGIAIAGIVLFFAGQIDSKGIAGNIIAIISGASMGMMHVLNGKIKDDNERMTAILCGHAAAAVIGVPIGLISTDFSTITIVPVLLVIFLGIFQMGIPYVLYGKAVSLISPVAVSLISMVEPILNPIWVAIFYHEVPGTWAYAGAILIIGAVTAYTVLDSKNSEK